jgi:hypothetical protein
VQVRSPVLLHHVRQLVGTATLQVTAQVLAFAAGLLVVHYFSLEQYAYYTLATAMLGVATTLSDSGMRDAVMAQGGAVWQQPDRLGAVLTAGLKIRRKIALGCAVLVCPVLIFLTLRQGATYLQAFLLCAALVPLFLATTVTPLLEIPLRIHQRLTDLQLLQLMAGVARIAGVLLVLLVFPVAWLVVLGGLLPQLLLNARLRRGTRTLAHADGEPDQVAQDKIARQLGRSMPGTVYYVLISQLGVLLISLFGSTESVAQFGALGRLALIAAFMLGIFQLIALPRYARIPAEDSGKLRRTYLILLGGVIAASALAVLFAWITPGAVLYILGPKYASLTDEAVLAIGAGVGTVISTAAGALAAVRGVVPSPLVMIPTSLIVQGLLVLTLPLDSVSTMFWLSIGVSGVQATVSITHFLFRRT